MNSLDAAKSFFKLSTVQISQYVGRPLTKQALTFVYVTLHGGNNLRKYHISCHSDRKGATAQKMPFFGSHLPESRSFMVKEAWLSMHA